jgi:hypothetical protein
MQPISISTTSIKPFDVKTAISLAINETANEAREKAIDVVAEKYNVSKFAIRNKTTFTPASPSRLIAYLGWKGTKMPVIQFNPVQTPTGVTAQILRGANKNYRHAFIRKSKSGKENVFIRIEAMSTAGYKSLIKKRGYRQLPTSQEKHGYPITIIKGISVPDMLKSASVRAKVTEFIAKYLPGALMKYSKWTQ